MKATSEHVKFRSLVERSITAWDWNSIAFSYVNHDDKAWAFKLHADQLRSYSSLDALLSHVERPEFWFFQLREPFLRQTRMTNWDPDRLDEYILLPIVTGFANKIDCVFVSHYWCTREHPDPDGHDLRFFQRELELVGHSFSYIWIDWTCMPQAPRSKAQQGYFKRLLPSISMLVQQCAFMWRFPTFEPCGWILFEVTALVPSHMSYMEREKIFTTASDAKPFVSHINKMKIKGVRPILKKYRYRFTNGSDFDSIIGLFELLIILAKIFPDDTDPDDVHTRRGILNEIFRDHGNKLSQVERMVIVGVEVNKKAGIVEYEGTTYRFTPILGT